MTKDSWWKILNITGAVTLTSISMTVMYLLSRDLFIAFGVGISLTAYLTLTYALIDHLVICSAIFFVNGIFAVWVGNATDSLGICLFSAAAMPFFISYMIARKHQPVGVFPTPLT